MTHVYLAGRAGSVPPKTSRDVPPKATLFCPRCGHESPVDGDWVLTFRSGWVDVQCPACRTVLTTRPARLATKERSARSQ